MKKVINLSTAAEYGYSESISDLFAVCNTYCLNHGLQSWFLSLVQNRADYRKSLPVTVGAQTIACGDYCIVKTDSPELELY